MRKGRLTTPSGSRAATSPIRIVGVTDIAISTSAGVVWCQGSLLYAEMSVRQVRRYCGHGGKQEQGDAEHVHDEKTVVVFE